MKRLFTLALVMAMTITGFAQVKSASKKAAMNEPAQAYSFRGEEEIMASFPFNNTRSIVELPEITELAYTTYDWQTNAGARNYTAVWPDGFAVMCYTLATQENFSDRGTGLAWFDPATGEWSFNELRAEDVKTGFGSIARYKENGLVIAAHTANDCRIFIKEDFRNNPTGSFGEGIVMPAPGAADDPCWPVVQCSGANLDIVHVLCTNNGATEPYNDPIVYYQYANGEWTRQCEILPTMTANELSDAGSNVCYFMLYDPAKPNRVSFIVNNAWSNCKCVISEDNGATWSDRVFFQHPNINGDFTDTWFFYPRWTNAAFDGEDNLHVVYEYNATTGTPGSGSYYPAIGGIGYWSEILPKNELCVGGIGEVGQPFIMDSVYTYNDIYASWPCYSDAVHAPVPEHIGNVIGLDENCNVAHGVEYGDENYYWVDLNDLEHGAYNSGKAAFATMVYDNNKGAIYAFWSMVAQDPDNAYIVDGMYYYRLFVNVSYNNGRTWENIEHVLTDFAYSMLEMAYDQAIPYVYNDDNGDYVWVCSQFDGYPGTFVQGDDPDSSDNQYVAVKVYLNEWYDGVLENNVHAAQTMNVYPNPAQGMFKVNLTYASDVNIYNAVGQLVKTYKGVKEVNVNLEAGVYFVNADNQTMKVIVK